MEAFLDINGLKKGYGQGAAHIQVLRGISVSVNEGELCVLLGPPGSGKSTFLNLVGGLEHADGGAITVGGVDLTALSDKDLGEYRRATLGLVFQFYNLVEDLTIRENIEVCEYISDDPLDVDELLRSLGLWEQRDKFPNQVSGGQQDGDAQQAGDGQQDGLSATVRLYHDRTTVDTPSYYAGRAPQTAVEIALGDMADDLIEGLHPVADEDTYAASTIDQAEKLSVSTLRAERKMNAGMEDVTVYGIQEDSRCWTDVDVSDGRVLMGEGLLHEPRELGGPREGCRAGRCLAS